MTAISELYPQTRIEAPGVPEPLLRNVVHDAMRDFFRDSECWRYTVPTLLDWTTGAAFPALTAGVELPADTRVKRVDVVKFGSDGVSLRDIKFKTRQQLDSIYSNWEVKTDTAPRYWTNDPNPSAPRLVPAAAANVVGSLKVRAIIVPTLTMTDVPDYFFDEFSEYWRYGALAELLRMPGRDWSNPKLANDYADQERQAIKMTKSRANAEYGQPERCTGYGGI